MLKNAEADLAKEDEILRSTNEESGRLRRSLNVPIEITRIRLDVALERPELEQFRPYFSAEIKSEKQWEAWDDARTRVKAARIACLSDPGIPYYEATSTFAFRLTQSDGEQLLRNYFQEDDASVALTHVARTPLWTVSVLSSDPARAAQRANGIVEGLQWLLEKQGEDAIKIWEKGEIAKEPIPIVEFSPAK